MNLINLAPEHDSFHIVNMDHLVSAEWFHIL